MVLDSPTPSYASAIHIHSGIHFLLAKEEERASDQVQVPFINYEYNINNNY